MYYTVMGVLSEMTNISRTPSNTVLGVDICSYVCI